MTDEIKTRLEECSKDCIDSYGAWVDNKKDSKASQSLQDAVHELRKISSRLEIELAISERDETKQKQIPIPPHRDARGRHQNTDDNAGNKNDSGNGNNKDFGEPKKAPAITRSRRRAPAKKTEG